MTYSIVALDRDSGQIGVGVQSHYFGVGSIVPWVEAGAGAVATQAQVERSYGPLGLDRMRSGLTAQEALAELLAADEQAAVRQVAMVDAAGSVAVHTGVRCIAEAAHVTGDGWSVQANMMTATGVPEAMAAAYLGAASRPLGDRILAALDAAENAGGDIRGRQSAALVVAEPGVPGGGHRIDVRVEDHVDPLSELRRLVRVREAYLSGDPDVPEMAGNPELAFWRGVALGAAGDVAAGRPFVRRAVDISPAWAELLRRLPPAGLLPDESIVTGLLGEPS